MVTTLVMVAALAGAYDPTGDVHKVPGPDFLIPCKLAAFKGEAKDVDAVRLYVSRDRGQTWELYESIAPDKAAFTFRAKKPGEYWFTAQVKMKDGTLNPSNVADFAPMQKALVASGTEPTLTKPTVFEALIELDEELTRAELDQIRKQIKRLTEEAKLTPEVRERIDRLRVRLGDLRHRLRPDRSSAPPLIFPDPLPAPKPDDTRLPSLNVPTDPLVIPPVRPAAPMPRAPGQR